MEEAVGAGFRGSERGVPNKHCSFKKHEAWAELAGDNAGKFNANKSAATLIKDPVLRLLQIYLGYNLLGQECCFTKVTLTKLYFIWKAYMHEPVNLAFWTAYQVHQISKNKIRHFSLCHILGAFLARNMQINAPSSIGRWEVVPFPTQFNTEFLISKLLARMKGGKVEIICSGCRDQSPDMQVQQKKEGEGVKKKRMVAIQKKPKPVCQLKEECQPMEEDQPTEEAKTAPAKVDKHVRRLKKEQMAQRDDIDKMQLLIQDLVRVLKESHIQQPAPSQQPNAEPEESNNDPMEAEATPEAEEEGKAIPQASDQEGERESTPGSKENDDIQEAEEKTEEPAPVDPRVEKKKKRKEQRVALKMRMKEKLRAMRRKAKSRAMRKRAATAAAKEASEHDGAEPSVPVQEEPVKSKKRRSKETPPEDKSLCFKRRR